MTLPLWLQIVALLIPAAVATFSALWASRSARRAQHAEHESARLRALEDRVAQKKYELYQPVLQTLGDVLTPSRTDEATERLEDVLADFQTFVTVWGSDEVVEAFYRYRTAANSPPSAIIIIRLMADFLVAVRRDIAWPDTRILNLHAIGMRINDLSEHPEMVEALTMPLGELFEREKCSAPFDLPNAR
ncbi:hypothetical protein ODZ83_08320 [Acaricomes phytoseiuli]|uniref:hypothetical protein n=1 Tax=Acaricomes phytoseiuli TaxID=291968 RepID=UPI00035C7260|nr:hypothetical protein [Acaricomes phytoseiuli]MCW1250182.1 hypothetical protein [Acaricomes phytoseiuli]